VLALRREAAVDSSIVAAGARDFPSRARHLKVSTQAFSSLEMPMKPPSEWVESDLVELIKDRVNEHIGLDYKSSAALDDPKAKTEISKDVSAFANSDGGVLVYGIVEDPKTHLPVRLDDGVDPSVISKEWIEQVINSNIRSRLDGVRINPVRIESSPQGRVAYVVRCSSERTCPAHGCQSSLLQALQFRISSDGRL
jgi:hypothetical protein